MPAVIISCFAVLPLMLALGLTVFVWIFSRDPHFTLRIIHVGILRTFTRFCFWRGPSVCVASLILVCLFFSAPQASAQGSPPSDSGSSGSSGGGVSSTAELLIRAFRDAFTISDKPQGANEAGVLALKVVAQSVEWSTEVGRVLLEEARSVAGSIILLVIFAEISFSACRIMTKASVVEEIMRLVMKTFIYVIVTGPLVAGPNGGGQGAGTDKPYGAANLIRDAMFRLSIAGRNIGMDIVRVAEKTAPTDFNRAFSGSGQQSIRVPDIWEGANTLFNNSETPSAEEPMVYWMKWIQPVPPTVNENGVPDASSLQYNPETSYVFSVPFLFGRILGDFDLKTAMFGNGGKVGADTIKGIADDAKDILKGIFAFSFIGQFVSNAMMVATIQTGSVLSVCLLTAGILVGSFLSFHVTAALGIACLPLMFFKTYDKIWSRYLTVLAGTALVPMFFYIFSGLGFVFSMSAFNVFFPPEISNAPRLGAVVMGMLLDGVMSILNAAKDNAASSGGSSIVDLFVVNAISGWIIGAVTALVNIMLYFTKLAAAATIVAIFIFAGSMLSSLAPRVAYKWGEGFGAEDLIDKVSEFFTNLQGTLGSTVGSQINEAVTKTASMGGGLLSRF